MTTDRETHVALKVHTCSWCETQIVPGETYHRWRYLDARDAGTVREHLECYEAMCRESGGGEIEWSEPRRRGMTMDEMEVSS